MHLASSNCKRAPLAFGNACFRSNGFLQLPQALKGPTGLAPDSPFTNSARQDATNGMFAVCQDFVGLSVCVCGGCVGPCQKLQRSACLASSRKLVRTFRTRARNRRQELRTKRWVHQLCPEPNPLPLKHVTRRQKKQKSPSFSGPGLCGPKLEEFVCCWWNDFYNFQRPISESVIVVEGEPVHPVRSRCSALQCGAEC